MKGNKAFILLFVTIMAIIVIICSSCAQIREIPTEKITYRDRVVEKIKIDSIYQYDSIYLERISDTIYMNRYKYMYKYKMLRDTAYISKIDSIPYTIEVVKEVNKLNSFQKGEIYALWILIFVLFGFAAIKLYKKFARFKIKL